MIEQLLLLYGIWALLNGIYACYKDMELKELSHYLLITWGSVTLLYWFSLMLGS